MKKYLQQFFAFTLVGLGLGFFIRILTKFDKINYIYSLLFKEDNICLFLGVLISFVILFFTKNNKEKNIALLKDILWISYSVTLMINQYEISKYLIPVAITIDFLSYKFLKSNRVFCLNEMYPSREAKKKLILDIILMNTKNLILIDGKWGIGKTYFINNLVRDPQVSTDHIIKIDVMLFKDRDHLISHTLNEIHKFFIFEGIRPTSLKKYKNILRFVSDNTKLKLNIFQTGETFDELENNLEEDLEKLKSGILIVIDNLERVFTKNIIADTLGFLYKLYSIKNSKINIFVLADSSKFLIQENINNEYIDKFFSHKIFLNTIDKFEILKQEILDFTYINLLPLDSFEKAFKEFDSIRSNLLTVNKFDREFTLFLKNSINDIFEKLQNPRNLRRVMDESLILKKSYSNIYSESKYFNSEIYNKQIILVSILKKLNVENFMISIKNIILDDLIIPKYNEEKEIITISNELYHQTFLEIFLGETQELKTFYRDERDIIARSYLRLLNDRGSDFEDKIKENMENILKEIFFSDDIFEVFEEYSYYLAYLDKENKSQLLYSKILDRFKNNDNIDHNKVLPIISSPYILEQDKEYSRLTKKSIFDKVYGLYNYSGDIHRVLRNSYFNEFYFFSRQFLFMKDTIMHLEINEFFKIFIKTYNEMYKTTERDIFKITREIVYKRLPKKNSFLKEDFEALLKKVNKVSTNQEEQIGIIINQELLLKFQELKEIENCISTNINERSYYLKEKEILLDISYLIEKDLNNFFSKLSHFYKYINKDSKFFVEYNNQLLQYILLFPNTYYEFIIKRIANFSSVSNNLVWKLELVFVLIVSKYSNFKKFNELLDTLELTKGKYYEGLCIKKGFYNEIEQSKMFLKKSNNIESLEEIQKRIDSLKFSILKLLVELKNDCPEIFKEIFLASLLNYFEENILEYNKIGEEIDYIKKIIMI